LYSGTAGPALVHRAAGPDSLRLTTSGLATIIGAAVFLAPDKNVTNDPVRAT
jgi:hypothetical protein